VSRHSEAERDSPTAASCQNAKAFHRPLAVSVTPAFTAQQADGSDGRWRFDDARLMTADCHVVVRYSDRRLRHSSGDVTRCLDVISIPPLPASS